MLRIFVGVTFSVLLATPSLAQVCLLYCPDACTLEFSSNGKRCSCQCEALSSNIRDKQAVLDALNKIPTGPLVPVKKNDAVSLGFSPSLDIGIPPVLGRATDAVGEPGNRPGTAAEKEAKERQDRINILEGRIYR
jgi:hypothetical protein